MDVAAVPLTSLSHGAGCGCKLPASALLPIVRALPAATAPELLVGSATGDDAAVWRMSDELALVQTVDFFTPVVDDPYDFGRIAAANALSDVYAMGGRPLTALNLVAWPLEQLGADMLGEVLRGGIDVVRAAGAEVVGGHSIDDPEPKYGLAVTGVVHPDRAITNAGGRAGDALVLTKPLGAGAVVTARKRGQADDALLARAVQAMAALNAEAGAAAVAAGASAMTDVTGFGLLGHLHGLARESGLAAEVDCGRRPRARRRAGRARGRARAVGRQPAQPRVTPTPSPPSTPMSPPGACASCVTRRRRAACSWQSTPRGRARCQEP